MKRKTKIGFFMLTIFWSVVNVLLAQNDVTLTPEQIINIQNSKEYFFGEGWDEIKDKAIDLALAELKSKLKNDEVKNYKITKLDANEGYYFMVFIEKNTPLIAPENVIQNEPIVNEIVKPVEKVTPVTDTGIKQEILNLGSVNNFADFIVKFQHYNRQNLLWGGIEKSKMNAPNKCYVAIFNKNDEMVLFLDRGDSSRRDLLKGNIVVDFETNYNNENYKIIWIELIEK
jgi:hypothetical protein